MIKQLEFSIPSSHISKHLTFDISFDKKNKKQPLVIFLHGFKGFKDWGHFNLIASNFANQGFSFLKLNFSHNGTDKDNLIDFVDLEAFGNNNFSKEIQDIDDLLNYLFSKQTDYPFLDLDNITLIGHSKGGATSLIKGMEDQRIHKIITWNGVIYLKERYANQLDEWKDKGVLYIDNARTNQQMPIFYQLAEDVLNNRERFNIPKLSQKSNKPILVIHCKEDQTVSIDEPLSIKENFTQLEVLETGSHTFDGSHPYNEKELPDSCLKALQITQDFISN